MADDEAPQGPIDPEVWDRLYMLRPPRDIDAPTVAELQEHAFDLSNMVLSYDPTPAPASPFEPGVTRGWLVLRDASGAYAAPAVVLADEDGRFSVESTTGDHFEMEPVEIVDDTDGRTD
jgi:hypothetical protein